jgi:hypothetical protein
MVGTNIHIFPYKMGKSIFLRLQAEGKANTGHLGGSPSSSW